MAITSIISLVLLGIIVICAWQGFKKGIIMGIIGVLVIILSLYGAQLLSDTFSYEVIPVMKPFVGGFLDSRVESTTYELFGYEADENGVYDAPYSVDDMLENQPASRIEVCRWVFHDLGVYEDMAESLAQKTVTYADQNGTTLSNAIMTVTCQSLSWYGGFLLAFILVFAALTVIVNIPNLSFRLPYIGIVNDIGGAAIGVFTGFLFCAIIAWVLQFTGLLIPETSLRGTAIASYFLDRNLLAAYITL